MNQLFMAAVYLAGLSMSAAFFVLLMAIIVGFVGILVYWLFALLWQPEHRLHLKRVEENPVLAPDPAHWWESAAVFNPGAIVDNGRVHIFYRAMGGDGVSRVGYASSPDGVHFDERLPYPVYASPMSMMASSRAAMAARGQALSYDTINYGSGGGWGGAEDPKVSKIGDRLYMTYINNNGWEDLRVVITSLSLEDFRAKRWNWSEPQYMSRRKERDGINNKSGVILEERVGDKHVIFHRIWPNISIDFRDALEFGEGKYLEEHAIIPAREACWDSHKISMASPPIKTSEGWLAIFHAADKRDWRYKIGAMILDINDPSKVLYRSADPILEPEEKYENDWKPGIVYPSGAVVLNGTLFVYYGGGDKYVAVAKADFSDFLKKLTHHQHAQLNPVRM